MRHEFSAKVKRAALARSEGRCEAIGSRYGYARGERCTAVLSLTGVQYDHWPLGAHAENSATLENCSATCPRCNQYAANHTDKAVEAKIKRIVRRNGPVELRKRKAPIRNRGFTQGPKAKWPKQSFPKRGRK